MKRPLTILLITFLTILVLYACSSTIRTSTTSFVTITFGEEAHTARLKAENATVLARARYLLADLKLMPEAYAYIPSVVQVLVVTVTASDMTTPIVGISSLSSNQTLATVRIEVPNGTARQFTVEGIRGVDSRTYYRGTASADLSGADVDLPISMGFVGTGIYVDPTLDPAVADQSTCGTQASPCATITHVLNTRPSTTNNDVILALPGTYKVGSAAAQETFPLQLKPGMALLCMGTGFSSVIDLQSAATTAIYGNDRASIDNCMVRVNAPAGGGVAVNDAIGGVAGQQSRVRVNGVYIELSGSPTGLANVGVVFFDDSLLLESAVTGSAAFGSIYGVQLNGGKPSIIGNTISNLPTGIDLTAAAGDAVISGNTIVGLNGNETGIIIATVAKPRISANTISNANTGILISAGDPEISGNIIDNNSVGIEVTASAGAPTIKQNSIYCSNYADLFSTATTTLDVTNNAWDHDSTTVPPGPEEWISVNGPFDCNFGADICAQNGPMPVYLPANAAVPNGCINPIAKPTI